MPRGAYDFYSPFMSGAIVHPSWGRYPLWVDVGKADAENVGLSTASLGYLTELTVEIQLAFLPKITAVLSPPFKEARELIDSKLLVWGRSILEVQLGYSGGTPKGPVLSPVFSGLIQRPDISFGSDAGISLTAWGIGGFTAQRQAGYFNTGDPMCREDIIKIIAAGPNGERRLNVDTSEVVKGPDPQAFTAMFVDRIQFDQAGMTDWFCIWKLVREARCWMTLIGDTLYIRPRNFRVMSKPKYLLRFYDLPGGLSPEEGIFPILSVSTSSMQMFLPQTHQGLLMRGMSSKTGESLMRLVDANTEPGAATNAGASNLSDSPDSPEKDKNTGAGAAFFGKDPSNEAFVSQAKAEMGNFGSTMGVKLDLETLGIPDITPGDVVAVRGISQKKYDGNYAVFVVTHSIGSSGYTTRLDLRSNVGALEGEYTNRLQADVNTQKADNTNQGKVQVPAKQG